MMLYPRLSFPFGRFAQWFGLLALAWAGVLSVCAQAPADPVQQPAAEVAKLNPKLPTVFVVGVSTANNHAMGQLGWGDPFVAYFDLSKVNVAKRARTLCISRTFHNEGLWDKV